MPSPIAVASKTVVIPAHAISGHELRQLLGMANKFLVLVHNGAPSYLYVTRLNLVLKK
jgi:hypothetical protein